MTPEEQAQAEATADESLIRSGLDQIATYKAEIRERQDKIAEVTEAVANAMGTKSVTIEGVGTVERHRVISRRAWDSDALLRTVLDTRLVNPRTGEITEESPIDKVKAVYPMAGYQARITALKARGIDVDEFCEKEVRGWSITVL